MYYQDCFCLYNNKLIGYCDRDNGLYEWNETTDTWTLMATISGTYSKYCFPWVINGDLYILSGKYWYRYNNGTITDVGTQSDSANVAIGVKGNWFYYATGSAPRKVYKYNVVTGEEKMIGRIPLETYVSVCYSDKPNDNFKLCFNDTGMYSCIAEMIEVEAEE